MHYREQPVITGYQRPDSFAANEACLLLSLLSANVLDAAAELLARHTRHQYSSARFRQLLLKVAGRMLLGGRSITVVVSAAVAPLWSAWWSELQWAYTMRGSPIGETLPLGNVVQSGGELERVADHRRIRAGKGGLCTVSRLRACKAVKKRASSVHNHSTVPGE